MRRRMLDMKTQEGWGCGAGGHGDVLPAALQGGRDEYKDMDYGVWQQGTQRNASVAGPPHERWTSWEMSLEREVDQ